MNLPAYQGGRRLQTLAFAVGAGGLAITLAGGMLGDPRRALVAYLVAFVYWVGLAIAVLILLGTLNASNARWSVVVHRFLQTVPQTLWLFLVLFLPIALGMTRIFPWLFPPGALAADVAHAIENKRPYLNVPFFLVRAAVYFLVWIVVAHLLRAWSLRQDETGGVKLTLWQRRLGAGSLPFLALTMSFASFDWMMSLDPRFFSTIFGVYWFAGSFMGAFAVGILAANATRGDPTGFGHYLTAEHYHSLGNLLLAFVAFWGYIAFSQLLLIWIADIPEEVPWYVVRINGGWLLVGMFLGVFHFLVPFFLLLSRDLKRNPRALGYVAAWLLFVHWVDLYWVVMPHLHPDGPRPSFLDLTAFVGVGAVAVGFTVLRMRGAAALPVRDPYLEDSLRYLPP